MPLRRPVSTGASIPAPVGGWNARDSLAAMNPLDAVRLDNLFPTTSTVDLRKGYAEHVTGIVNNVESLMEYAGPSSRKLIAAAGGAFYDVSVAGAVGAAQESGHLNDRWQHINFGTAGGHFMYAVNGLDAPRNFDGTTWTTPTITGIATPSRLIGVMAHQRRLFFIEKETLKFWYFPVATISGAMTSFDLSQLFPLGGQLMAMATWTVDGGAGLDDLAVFVTSAGEAAVYAGTDPGSANTWTLRGVFRLSPPIGRRCLHKIGGDLVVITEDGFYPLSAALISSQSNPGAAISDKISGAVRDASRAHRAKFGWQPILYPRGQMFIVNVPLVENGTAEQFVMNARTGAWCRFTEQDANCWSLFNDDLYFGGTGTVYKADSGTNDDGADITGDVKTAFNYFGNRGRLKRFTMVRPLILADGNFTPAVGVNVDYADLTPAFSETHSGSEGTEWDAGDWDSFDWAGGMETHNRWRSVAGVGYCAAVRMQVAAQNFGVSLNAFDVLYEPGGHL